MFGAPIAARRFILAVAFFSLRRCDGGLDLLPLPRQLLQLAVVIGAGIDGVGAAVFPSIVTLIVTAAIVIPVIAWLCFGARGFSRIAARIVSTLRLSPTAPGKARFKLVDSLLSIPSAGKQGPPKKKQRVYSRS